MNGHPAVFDPATQAYLKDLDRRSGAGHDGVFIRRSVSPFSNPRSGWVLLLLGAVCLGDAVLLCLSPETQLNLSNQQKIPYHQAIATTLGLFCLLSGVARYRRPAPTVELRSFLFADGAYLWDVNPDHVQLHPLAELTSAEGFHSFVDRVYCSTTLTLRFRARVWKHELEDKALAERFVNFLNAELMFRDAPEAESRHMAPVPPGLLAALAIRVIDNRRYGTPPLPAACPNPPTPTLIPRNPEKESTTRRSFWLRFLAAGAAGGLSLVGFAALNRYVLDEHLFAHVPVAYPGDIRAFDRYLNALPDGRHVAEVQERKHEYLFQWALEAAEQARSPAELRTAFDRYLAVYPNGGHAAEVRARWDDGLFRWAVNSGKEADSPANLRDYLADANNKRHRKEARDGIGGYYERAMTDMKERAGKMPGKVDQELFNAFLAVLEGMKQADGPVVTVGFKARVDPEPTTPRQQILERQLYDFHLRKHPELKALADRQPQKTALLPRGEVFEADQVARREAVILGRLTAAIKKGIKHEVLTLAPVPAGQTPVLEVAYHIYAAGELGPYTRTTTIEMGGFPGLGRPLPGAQPVPVTTKEEIVGLVRWYAITWTITVRPRGAERPFVHTINSEALLRLNYDSRPGDPAWAPYAVILYSGFYDMSARLTRSFGLDPGPAPNAFTFAAAASTKADLPIDPMNPVAPGEWDPPPWGVPLPRLPGQEPARPKRR